MDFNLLLKDLASLKLLKVTGSYADGTNNEQSDIDFYVKPDHPEQHYNERNMLKVIKVLKKYGIKWHSTQTGYISTIGDDNPTLEIELEFADCFHRRKGKLSTVTIQGVLFKTH